MNLSLGLVTDLHFGPEARFEGKLRKLSHKAESLTEAAVRAIDRAGIDALVNLGDDIEDEDHPSDLSRYLACQTILKRSAAPLINVAGNHDTVFLKHRELAQIWGAERSQSDRLYYSLDLCGWHVVVLHTVETRGVEIRVGSEQLRWLRDDLARARSPSVVLMHHSASEQDLDDSRWFSRAPQLALVKNRTELREVFEAHDVRAVFNGHVHRNHIDFIRGIAYITLQSLIENLDDDAPGRAAGAWTLARLSPHRMVVRVHGQDPARYQVEWGDRG